MKKTLIAVSLACSIVGCATDRHSASGGSETGSAIATGGGSQTVAAADSSFAREACQTGVAEVELGRLAAKNTRNREVRALARTIAEDHAQAEKELGRLFARKGLPPEKEMAANFRNSLDRLAGLKGAEFDRAFKEQVIEDHENAIELFERQRQDGTDPDLKAFAEKHLPHLREHLATAQQLEISSDGRSKPDPTAADVLANPAVRNLNVPR
jgi:putative membrane protein